MKRLPRQVPYNEIMRGKIFNVAVPFTHGRPFDFVVKSSDGTFQIINKDDGFEGYIDPVSGKRKAQTVKIVTEYKLRPAVVIQVNNLNKKNNYDNVIVLPITSLSDADKKDDLIKQVMDKNDIDHFHFIGNILGADSMIIVSDPKRVHKNTLFKPRKEIVLDEQTISAAMYKLAACLAIRRTPQCEECEHNCEKCELKMAVNK